MVWKVKFTIPVFRDGGPDEYGIDIGNVDFVTLKPITPTE